MRIDNVFSFWCWNSFVDVDWIPVGVDVYALLMMPGNVLNDNDDVVYFNVCIVNSD